MKHLAPSLSNRLCGLSILFIYISLESSSTSIVYEGSGCRSGSTHLWKITDTVTNYTREKSLTCAWHQTIEAGLLSSIGRETQSLKDEG